MFYVINTTSHDVQSAHRTYDNACKAFDKLRRMYRELGTGCFFRGIIVECNPAEIDHVLDRLIAGDRVWCILGRARSTVDH